MNARPISREPPRTASPRFDRKFIEDHKLIERYLDGQLPYKGARDLEAWCRAHPEYLIELKLSDRAQASLKLLDASGKLVDLGEPRPPWWKTPYVLVALSVIAALAMLAFWAMIGKYWLLRGELDDYRAAVTHGSLVQPAATREIRVSPDRAPNIGRARIAVARDAPQLMDLHIDMSYTNDLTQFRLSVDKQDQGRALVLNNLVKDSNGELRMTLNSTGLAAGIYNARLEALPFRGAPLPIGWVTLEVQ